MAKPSVEKTVAALAARDKRELAKPAATAQPKEKRSVLHDLYESLGKLLNGKQPRDVTHDGRTIDEVVDEAVSGAKGANPDY